MGERVLGGILLLAFLISVGATGDVSEAGQSGESGVTDSKETEIVGEDNHRKWATNVQESSDNNLHNTKGSDTDRNDLKIEATTPHSVEQSSSLKETDITPLIISDSSPTSKYFMDQPDIRVQAIPESDIMSPKIIPSVNESPSTSNTEKKNKVPAQNMSYNPKIYTLQENKDTSAEDTSSNKFSATTTLNPPNYKNGMDYTKGKVTSDDHKEYNLDDIKFNKLSNSYPYTPDLNQFASNERESTNMRSGNPYTLNYSPYQMPMQNTAETSSGVNLNDNLNTLNQWNPYAFGYQPGVDPNIGNEITAIAKAQSASSGNLNARSRVIWPHEYIFPHQTPGGENIIYCSREYELHHFWSRTLDCLVCICLNQYGSLQPVCASCSKCQAVTPLQPQPYVPEPLMPTPEPYIPLPLPDFPNTEPFTPPVSPQPIFIEPAAGWYLDSTSPTPTSEGGCHPLPTEQPFTNPLNPCQICICNKNINVFGKPDIRIDCQENPNCVVPADVATILPPLPDIPFQVPLPLCEKFPPHVTFPHPTESCKECKCSVELSVMGTPEQHITCFNIPDCAIVNTTPKIVIPPAPPIPVPVQPYAMSLEIEPSPELYPVEIPAIIPTPENEIIPWPPVRTTEVPSIPPPIPVPIEGLIPGPLPGPPPHESCRPYPPNQPFEHPWDPCQICQCSESITVGLVNVEINCRTKLSCCIIAPEDMTLGGDTENQIPIKYLYNAPNMFKPPSLTKYVSSADAYVTSNDQNSNYQPAGLHQAGKAISTINGDQATAQASTQTSGLNPGYSQSQGYAEINPTAYLNYPSNMPEMLQSANAFSSVVNGGSQSSSEASANINHSPVSHYIPGFSQNPAYAEANAVNNVGYNMFKPYQIATLNNTKNIRDYSPQLDTKQPSSLYSQAYSEASTQYKNPQIKLYNLPEIYNQYNPGFFQNKAYAEANSQQNQANVQAKSEANAVYNRIVTSTNKPDLYMSYNPELYYPANSQYGIIPNTQNSAPSYDQYNLHTLYATEKPMTQPYIPRSQNQVYWDANTLGTLMNPTENQGYTSNSAIVQNAPNSSGYHRLGPYQSAKVFKTVHKGDLSSPVADVFTPSQEISSPYIALGSDFKKPTTGYPYQSNYYEGFLNSQLTNYPGIMDQVLDGYYDNQLKYTDKYDTTQNDAKNVLTYQNSYYPLSSGYAQGLGASELYSSPYPKVISYDINQLQSLGYVGSSNDIENLK